MGKINTGDVKILVENILDLSLNVSRHNSIAVSICPLCGKMSKTQFDIEYFPHNEHCGYPIAIKLYNDLGMDDE